MSDPELQDYEPLEMLVVPFAFLCILTVDQFASVILENATTTVISLTPFRVVTSLVYIFEMNPRPRVY